MGSIESTCWTVVHAAAAGSSADRDELARRYLSIVRSSLGARWRGSSLVQDLDDAVQEVFIESTLGKAIALKPNDYAGHFNLGNLYLRAGQAEKAVPCFQKCCETNTKEANCYYSLGMSLKAAGKIEDARISYRKAIELNPKFAEAYCNLGILLKDLGQFDESLAALERGHGLGSKRPGWRYPSAFWLRSVQHFVALNKKLPA